jgi:DNA polymerase III alpha subunit
MSTKTNTIEQLVEGVVTHGPDILEHCVCSENLDNYIKRIEQEFLNYPKPKTEINPNNWFMPDSYRDMDIYNYVLEQCPNDEKYMARVQTELHHFEKQGMFMLLKQIKYIVDTLRKNNIVWGVGRGSSVASYVLHLLGVHRIDSVKYDIPLNEFFKGV